MHRKVSAALTKCLPIVLPLQCNLKVRQVCEGQATGAKIQFLHGLIAGTTCSEAYFVQAPEHPPTFLRLLVTCSGELSPLSQVINYSFSLNRCLTAKSDCQTWNLYVSFCRWTPSLLHTGNRLPRLIRAVRSPYSDRSSTNRLSPIFQAVLTSTLPQKR